MSFIPSNKNLIKKKKTLLSSAQLIKLCTIFFSISIFFFLFHAILLASPTKK